MLQPRVQDQSKLEVTDTDADSLHTDLYGRLCRKLLEGNAGGAGLPTLASLLEGTLTQLVAELSGPNKESALNDVWQQESLFQHAIVALRVILDNHPVTQNFRLKFFSDLFERQLEQVIRLLKQSSRQDSVTYLDRIQLKDSLHHLLQTAQSIGSLDDLEIPDVAA